MTFMFRHFFLLLAGLIASTPPTLAAAQTASARLWCESLRFSRGTYGDQTLELSTLATTVNGEFAYYDGQSLITAFTLASSGLPISGSIVLELPPYWDLNNNGFDDFYESSQSVSGSSSGDFETSVSTGTVTAAWSRPAGSKNGSCVLKLVDSTYGWLGDFTHSFELLEYVGPLTYTRGTNTIAAQVTLEQTGNTTNKLVGPLSLTRSSTNRFDVLQVSDGSWTNSAGNELYFPETTLFRDAEWPTNYYGYFDFIDGYPPTQEPDYLYWTISIDDLNDANSNGIPDFSDDPVLRPRLALEFTSNELLLRLSGSPGRLHEIQQSPSLASDSWQTVRSLQVTNDPQVVSLPLPAGNQFWRVLLP